MPPERKMKLKKLCEQWLSNPDVRTAFEAQTPEFEIARTLIKARLRSGIAQA